MEDLIIVGAGFAGLACAQAAAHRGLNVTVIDKKPSAGARPHTTGLIVKEAAEAWDIPARLTRKIRGVRVYGPSLAHLDLESPGYYFLATDTAGVLDWLAARAEKSGARLRFGTAYRGAAYEADSIALTETNIRTRYLVGADGPRSGVARDFTLGTNREWLHGVELHYVGARGIDPDRLHVFLDSDLAPGYIGWAVPSVDDQVQIGLACHRDTPLKLAHFIKKARRLFDFSAARLVERRGGLIPINGPLRPFAGRRVLLVGDAAGLVSPLTAGGIHLALDSGRRAGHAIGDFLLDNGRDPSEALLPTRPRLLVKRGMRSTFDLGRANVVYDALVSTPLMAALARWVFFHKRGPFSAQAWREILQARAALVNRTN